MLIDTDAAAAVSLANEACRAVQTLDLPHSASSTAACITISAGVSGCVPTIDGALDRLLAAADGALYRAKKLGRNRAELAA